MANKFAALLVICLVFVAAVQLPKAMAGAAEAPANGDGYTNCLKDCIKECEDGGSGRTICEMQCDTDCFNKDLAAKLHISYPQ